MRPVLVALCLFPVAVQAVELPVVSPHEGIIHRWIRLPASFAPWQQVDLRARVDGYVASVAVDKGDVVAKGQRLVVIEVPDLEADLIRHRAEAAAAEVQVKRLHEARAASPDLVLPQDVDDAEAQLAIARAGLQRAETLLAFAQIEAPFGGTVTARFVDPGAFAAAGGSALLQVTDLGVLRLQIPVVERECGFVQVNQPVEATVEALGGEAFSGKVSRISGVLDSTTRTMLVEADFPNPKNRLRPGMFATARLAVERHERARLVPVTALVREKSSAHVFKHVGGKAMKTVVKPGFDDGVHVELPDLSLEDVLLVPGTVPLVDGQEVTAVRAASGP